MSSKAKLPRDHHYVAQVYLQGFSQDGNSIFRLDKKTGIIKQLGIRIVGFQKDLYTYKGISGKKKTLENMLGQMEGIAAIVIRKLENYEEITDQDRADLSIFLSMQMLRTPASQSGTLGFQKEIARRIMMNKIETTSPDELIEIIKKIEGREITILEAEDLLDFATNPERSNFEVDIPQEFWIKQLLNLSMEYCRYFQKFDWEIKHSETAFGFITSDHPFNLIPSKKPNFQGFGLITPNVKKVIPLTAKICLIAHDGSESPVLIHTQSDKNNMRFINQETVRNAEKYVFCSHQGKLEVLIKKNKELLKTPVRYYFD